jgi:hypothetical protein
MRCDEHMLRTDDIPETTCFFIEMDALHASMGSSGRSFERYHLSISCVIKTP